MATPGTPVVAPAPEAEVAIAPPYVVSNQNLVVNNGGGRTPTTGHQSHYPIWLDKNGVEYIYIAGVHLTKLSDLNFATSRRETVVRR